MSQKQVDYGVWIPFKTSEQAYRAAREIQDKVLYTGIVMPETEEIAEAARRCARYM